MRRQVVLFLSVGEQPGQEARGIAPTRIGKVSLQFRARLIDRRREPRYTQVRAIARGRRTRADRFSAECIGRGGVRPGLAIPVFSAGAEGLMDGRQKRIA